MLDYEALKRWADVRNTSEEVAQAIFHFADGDDDAQRIWDNPSEDEMAKVIHYAWACAGDSDDTLHWGSQTLRRKT